MIQILGVNRNASKLALRKCLAILAIQDVESRHLKLRLKYSQRVSDLEDTRFVKCRWKRSLLAVEGTRGNR
jgi:hypothetical protein